MRIDAGSGVVTLGAPPAILRTMYPRPVLLVEGGDSVFISVRSVNGEVKVP